MPFGGAPMTMDELIDFLAFNSPDAIDAYLSSKH